MSVGGERKSVVINVDNGAMYDLCEHTQQLILSPLHHFNSIISDE